MKEIKYKGKGYKPFHRFEVICNTCGNILYIIPAMYKRQKQHFCNRKCLGTFNKQRLLGLRIKNKNNKVFKCDFCGKIEYKRTPSQLSKRNFCSKICANKAHKIFMTGDNYPYKRVIASLETRKKISESIKNLNTKGSKNPNWKGGKTLEPYGTAFCDSLKEKIRDRDNRKCQLCGVPEIECYRKLDIHHIDYDKKNNNINNLISLCRNCHAETNGDRNYWINYFKELLCMAK